MQQAPPPVVNREELREQIQQSIRQSIEDAQTSARDARVYVQDGGGAAAGVPVGIATTQPPWTSDPADMPVRVQETAFAFFFTIAVIAIGFPIARALARRIDRSGTTTKIPREVTAQLAQLNQSVEAIAIEVERISEGQRFTTKLLSEQHKLPVNTRAS